MMTATSPMSGIPMNTSPNMNNASLTSIDDLQAARVLGGCLSTIPQDLNVLAPDVYANLDNQAGQVQANSPFLAISIVSHQITDFH